SPFPVLGNNSGVSDADNLSLNDTVDPRLIVDSVSAGDYTCPDGDSNPQTITCSLAHLDANGTKSITVSYHVAAATDSDPSVSNSATAQSDEAGPNSGSDTGAITEDVHLSVTKHFADPSVTAGGAPSSFTVSVHNSGVSDADNLSLNDTVDPRLSVDSVSAGDYTCPDGDSNPQTITCSLAHLAANGTKSITVSYHVAAATDSDPSVSNSATAQSDE